MSKMKPMLFEELPVERIHIVFLVLPQMAENNDINLL